MLILTDKRWSFALEGSVIMRGSVIWQQSWVMTSGVLSGGRGSSPTNTQRRVTTIVWENVCNKAKIVKSHVILDFEKKTLTTIISYRQQIARQQLRTRYAEGIYRHKYYTVTLKSRLSITQGHWKRNHWIDHTRLSSSRVIWRWILLWPWNVG